MKQQMEQVATKFADVEGVGISSPGSVDSKLGVIRGISAIPYIHNFEIVKELTELFNKQVTIENAANVDYIFSMLMGDDVAPRREFIEKNATYANIDA